MSKCPNEPNPCFCDGRCHDNSPENRAYWAEQIGSAKRRMREWPQWMRDNAVFHGRRRDK